MKPAIGTRAAAFLLPMFGMRGTRDRVPRCTRILPLDISKGPEQVEPAIPSASLARMSPRARQ